MKFAKSLDPGEAAHRHEPAYLELHCLPSSV